MSTSVTGESPSNRSMYVREEKIHPREVDGRFDRLRKLAMVVLLGMFYGGPWLTWEGRQAVLFDLPARKFYLFGLTFWPQDFLYLALLLIMAAISLFFFTALAGRLWCGYACPQTVWTEAFALIERAFEGRRAQRIKLDKAPWTFDKLWRKTGKQIAWIAFALFTGFCFVAYFVPVDELTQQVLTLTIGGWTLFWVLFYGFATYGNAAYMREQVCKYMCPYARFQSAMFDKDSLIITYDVGRGEPRGGRSRKADPASLGLGDCIDCTLCVQACPTGIDIRDGLQYECIACAACIDACDSVMDKMDYPRGLVRYSTENAMSGQRTRVFRPRVLIYATLLTVLGGAFVTSLATRVPLIVDVIKDRNSLYREVGVAGIENTYQLHIINKDRDAHEYEISVAGVEGIHLTSEARVSAAAETLINVPVAVQVPHEYASGGHAITFTVRSLDEPTIERVEQSRFRGPVTR
ncbi:MAG: cytochrome c oxidase accessory protein CcoG [Pseudomonadota bacterium]